MVIVWLRLMTAIQGSACKRGHPKHMCNFKAPETVERALCIVLYSMLWIYIKIYNVCSVNVQKKMGTNILQRLTCVTDISKVVLML